MAAILKRVLRGEWITVLEHGRAVARLGPPQEPGLHVGSLAHLRTALWFHRHEPLDCFVTRDEAQRQAAKELGLPAP
jgi:antitoxin (DNA-binding transcriptional repressor) of toxin-antitoxin stability system